MILEHGVTRIPRKGFLAFCARTIHPVARWAYRTFWQSITVARYCHVVFRMAYEIYETPEFKAAKAAFIADYLRFKNLEAQYKEYEA